MVITVNNSELSEFGDFGALNLQQMKFIFTSRLYGNYTEMKNQYNECMNVRCFPKSPNMLS